MDRMSNYIHIVRGVREHNANSQMRFYDLFIRRIFRTAYVITGNEYEAEEIAQDTILKVFDRTELLHDDAGDMERVLRRIASNAAIDVTRRRKDFIFTGEELPEVEEQDDEDERPDYSVEEIREAIATLSVSYRNILSLRLFEERSFAEVAELLAVNYSTVRVQYTRAIRQLRDLLTKKRSYGDE